MKISAQIETLHTNIIFEKDAIWEREEAGRSANHADLRRMQDELDELEQAECWCCAPAIEIRDGEPLCDECLASLGGFEQAFGDTATLKGERVNDTEIVLAAQAKTLDFVMGKMEAGV